MHYVSRIHQFFPKELMIELNKICHDVLISDNNTKVDKMNALFDKYNLPYSELGPGTNRYAIMIDGYVFKIAMDKDGIRDNLAEFSMAMELQPFVTKIYECNGLIIVAEYVTAISKAEFLRSREEIQHILIHLSQGYLLGDVGTIAKNFMNWGYRPDGSLVILDFAYVYRVIGDEMMCDNILDDNKPCGAMLEYDDNYNKLICPRCRKKYIFHEIRRRINKDYEEKELDAIKKIAIKMTSETLDTNPGINKPKEKINTNKGEETVMKHDNIYEPENTMSEEDAIESYQEAMRAILEMTKTVARIDRQNVPPVKLSTPVVYDDVAEDEDDDATDYRNIHDFLNELSRRDPDESETDEDEDLDEDEEDEDDDPYVNPVQPSFKPVVEEDQASVIEDPDEDDEFDPDPEDVPDEDDDDLDEEDESESDDSTEINEQPQIDDTETKELREEIIDVANDIISTESEGTVIEYEPDERQEPLPAHESSHFDNNEVFILSNASKEIVDNMRKELISDISVEPTDDCDDSDEYTDEYDELYEENFRSNQAYKQSQQHKRNKGDN